MTTYLTLSQLADSTYGARENPLPGLLVHWLPVLIPVALVLMIGRVVKRRSAAARWRLACETRYRLLIDEYNLTAAAYGTAQYWVPDEVRRTAMDLAWRLAC